MDYAALFSASGQLATGVPPPPVMAPVADLISFAIGQPDPDSMPIDDLTRVTRLVLDEPGRGGLLYGPLQGDPGLRTYVAERLNEKEGLSLTPEQLVITTGSSQAIALVAQLMIDAGDTILVEGPTFLGAVRTFRLFRAQVEELPLDDGGLVVSELERRLEALGARGIRPKFLYTLPTFHNPAGVTMPLDRRLELLEVAGRAGLLVVEDDAYGDLRYEGSDLPSLLALDRRGIVLRLGTFSKILAAGLRLGWAAGPAGLVQGLVGVKTDSGTNPYAARLATEWARAGLLEPHVSRLRQVYRERRDALLGALERYCSTYCSWTRPEGGFFVWVELKEIVDPERLRQSAAELGVAYLPGQHCFASGQGHGQLRLSFSSVDPRRIEEGVRRLGVAFRNSLRE